jgi:hypothetical protein
MLVETAPQMVLSKITKDYYLCELPLVDVRAFGLESAVRFG